MSTALFALAIALAGLALGCAAVLALAPLIELFLSGEED